MDKSQINLLEELKKHDNIKEFYKKHIQKIKLSTQFWEIVNKQKEKKNETTRKKKG